MYTDAHTIHSTPPKHLPLTFLDLIAVLVKIHLTYKILTQASL